MQSSRPSQNTSPEFPQNLIMIAARWWAQFLPGMKRVTFEDIIKNTNFETNQVQTIQQLLSIKRLLSQPVTDTQYHDFVKILSEKICASPCNPKIGNQPAYIKIGHISMYDLPDIIEKSIEEAGIKLNANGLFPFKTEMKIYSNGVIHVGDEAFSIDPDMKHYHAKTDFSASPLMKISGNKFRIVEITLSELKKPLYEVFYTNEITLFETKRRLVKWSNPTKEAKHAFAKFELKDFKGTEEEFLALTDAELIAMLQDITKLKERFDTTEMYTHYTRNKKRMLGENGYYDMGSVTTEEISPNYYQYVTTPAKVISIQEKGMIISRGSIQFVEHQDFIVLRDTRDGLNFMNKRSSWVARLCDQHGRVLSDRVFKPGDEIPLASSLQDAEAAAIAEIPPQPRAGW